MQNLPKKSLLPFTEEHEAFRKDFGEFLDREIVPYYMDMEKNHSVGKETFKKFGDAGYGCLWLDKKYGGREVSLPPCLLLNLVGISTFRSVRND